MATSGPDVAALVALQQAALQTIAACEQRGQGVAALQTLLPTSLASDNQAQQQHESDTMSEQRTENDGGTGSMPGDGTTPPGRGGSGSASQQLALTPTQFRAPTKDGKEEYLYLSHTFVHQKLRAFVPPCPVEVQLEVNGQVQPAVYPGQLQDSTAKGFYCLDAPPKELVAGQDITGIRLKTDGRIAIQVQPRKRPLASDEGRRRVRRASKGAELTHQALQPQRSHSTLDCIATQAHLASCSLPAYATDTQGVQATAARCTEAVSRPRQQAPARPLGAVRLSLRLLSPLLCA